MQVDDEVGFKRAKKPSNSKNNPESFDEDNSITPDKAPGGVMVK